MKLKSLFIFWGAAFVLVQCTPSTQAVPTAAAVLPPTSTPTVEIIPPTPTNPPQVILPEIRQELTVPQGKAPTIDGTFSEGEWEGALVSELSDGSRLMFLQDGGTLYLGIRSQKMGVASICTKRDDQIWILHSSAALGNTIYEKSDADWQMVEGFEWCCRDRTPNDEQAALLEEKGWTASIGYMGNPRETEFQIAMEDDAVTLAIAYYLGRTQISVWPNWLDDDCPSNDVVEGSPPENVQFDTDSWITLKAQDPGAGNTIERPSDGMVMVYVPGGTFTMGSTQAQIDTANALCEQYPDAWGKCAESEAAFIAESPPHEVTLDSFWIDRTEVTYGQYALCVANGMCRSIGSDESLDDLPAAAIPWKDAAAYCDWAGGRLPTEAEWEYAAKGVSGNIYPWGNEFVCQYGNFSDDISKCDDEYPQASPVGSFPEGASWCGALDMAGNVWEWVADEFQEYTTEKQVNPIPPPMGGEGILRGGSWGYGPGHIRTTFRYVVPLSANYQAVGFRCVMPGDE